MRRAARERETPSVTRVKNARATSPSRGATEGGKIQRMMRNAWFGAHGVGIADLGAAEIEAVAEVVGVADDKRLERVHRALEREEAVFEFLRVCGRGYLHERCVLRAVAAGAPGLAPDCVVEA